MRLLHRLGHHAYRLDHAVLDSPAPFPGRFDRPWRLARWNAPVLARVTQHVLGPGRLDDAKAFLEGRPIGGVDLVMLMRLRAMNAMRLLGHDIDPSPLLAARA